jgi:N-acetylglucosamine-6-sulfatase
MRFARAIAGTWTRQAVRILILGLACLVLVTGAVLHAERRTGATARTSASLAAGPRPNIVILLTDDQRADETAHMTTLHSELMNKGITFDRSFVVDPLCCPARISLLRGQTSHTTSVWNVQGTYGGWPRVQKVKLERSTLATWLDTAGYRTALIGKYLNGYTDMSYVPPGWDYWRGLLEQPYANFTVSEDGTPRQWNDAYNTTVMTDYADSFIRGTPSDEPLFLYLSYIAPHEPTVPDTKYQNDPRCLDVRHDGDPAFNEADVSDKPPYIRKRVLLSPSAQQTYGVARPQNACRTLLSVDDGLASVIDALTDTGRMDTTMFIYTSDNGILDGEHRHTEKKVPYEESIRVPLVVRYDPLTGGVASHDPHMVLNIDIAPTLTSLDGLSVKPGCPTPPYGSCTGAFDGRSFLPLLTGTSSQWRTKFLIEHWDDPSGPGIPTYCGVRTERYKFVHYRTGDEELYDLQQDPHELTNVLVAGGLTAPEKAKRNQLRTTLFGPGGLCLPPPPGLKPPP